MVSCAVITKATAKDMGAALHVQYNLFAVPGQLSLLPSARRRDEYHTSDCFNKSRDNWCIDNSRHYTGGLNPGWLASFEICHALGAVHRI